MHSSFERFALKQSTWDRRDAAASYEQEEETLRLVTAFREKRILMSRARLKAEAYLSQN